VTDERLASMSVEGFLAVLGSDAPTPGGGAAGAIAGATGAALIAMVGRLTVGKEGFEDLEDRMRALVESADAARAAFLELADRDAHERHDAAIRLVRQRGGRQQHTAGDQPDAALDVPAIGRDDVHPAVCRHAFTPQCCRHWIMPTPLAHPR